ncbi:hypothetical protein IFHNHDMJ_02378 [Synechococcus sp. CBW1107]|nr:hypothetical protein IFHNHDMJ_02378 [Synechococcus sp. CBW1107]
MDGDVTEPHNQWAPELIPRRTFSTVFHELAAILVLAGVIGVLALKLRQPLIISYIATGIVAGPAVLGWASGGRELKLLSSIGISVLLFVVGLKLGFDPLRGPGGLGHGPRPWLCTLRRDARGGRHCERPGRKRIGHGLVLLVCGSVNLHGLAPPLAPCPKPNAAGTLPQV